MKNARGFIKPQNLKLLRGFAKDLGAGIAIEFFAGWAIDRGLEYFEMDEKSILERNVLRFNRYDKEKQKSIIERLNNELEKELKYQKTFFAKAEKVIALGDMTINERKIKSLASFLTAISVSGAGSVYDLVSAGPLPDYLGSDVNIELPTQASVKPSASKISMPPLPPTGTGDAALAAAQAYGASRDGGKRRHAGVDFDPANDKNSKFYSRIGGEVIYAANAGGGYGNVVDIYNAELGVTERIAEGDRIHVKKGDIIKPGTLVQSGSSMTGVFHYEIRKGKAGPSGAFEGTIDPLKFLEKLKSNGNQASFKTSSSSLISSAGLNQSTTYSNAGMFVRREVNNIFVPIAA
jgi:murein DD-endopeptidase MepM/ murein hydrolase activator NlpD